jgi:hypothetical protein
MNIKINNKKEWKEVQYLLFELDCGWTNTGKVYWSKYESILSWDQYNGIFIVEKEKILTWSGDIGEQKYISASLFLRKYKLKKLNDVKTW